MDVNYESRWWSLIYDQMMTSTMADVLQGNLAFYRARLEGLTGRVLECACGTGLILLRLLEAGHDIHGFDISEPMLDTLRANARALGIHDIEQRVSVQRLETFRYKQRFAAILVPTNSFSMLTSQEAQLAALANIHEHLEPDGRLLLDLQLVDMRSLVDGGAQQAGRWHLWTHPETGRPIRQRIVGRVDFDRQWITDTCVIEYEGETTEFPMTSRWVSAEEFALLLRHTGFADWSVAASPAGAPLVLGPDGQRSYWTARKTR